MKIVNRLLLIVLVLSLISCEDVLEKDISNSTVEIISPTDNQEIHSNAVNFQWNALTGAKSYRIQVYSSNSNKVVDSLVTKTNLNVPLPQGSYTWKMRAENFAYSSTYTNSRSFSLIETTDLTYQTLVLLSPSDSFYTNNSSIILTWQSLNVASSYTFQLIKVTGGNSVINQQSNLTNTTLNLTNAILNADAQYKWNVKAVNSSSQTQFSSRLFYLDTVVPNQPINVLPANNSTQIINQQLTFSWTTPTDSGVIQSPITYDVEFSNNSSFSSIIQTSNVSTTSIQKSFTTVGDYYWRVKAKDLAGNVGAVSSPFKFTIN